MGKPFGLLHRILSFSKGSKRSKSHFQSDNVDEHGAAAPNEEPNDNHQITVAVRTTRSINGLITGTQNVQNDIADIEIPTIVSKRCEKGMKKRRLRRASLSASNLLSWGYERDVKHAEPGGQDEPCKVDNPGSPRGEEGWKGQYNSKPDFFDTGKRPCSPKQRVEHTQPKRQTMDDESFTRLLRSSSTNYRVINETDFRALAPIDHPINAFSLSRSKSEHLPGAAPPPSWGVCNRTSAVGFPPFPASGSLQQPSLRSNTVKSQKNYRVTVHRRRVHSRTDFPDANKALEHLHSSSCATTTHSVDSPRETPDVPDISIPGSAFFSDSRETKRDSPNDVLLQHFNRYPQKSMSTPASSMLPKLAAKTSIGTDLRHTRNNQHIHKRVSSVSQIYPVAPLLSVPAAPTHFQGRSSSSVIPKIEGGEGDLFASTNAVRRQKGLLINSNHYKALLKDEATSGDESDGSHFSPCDGSPKSRNVLKKGQRPTSGMAKRGSQISLAMTEHSKYTHESITKTPKSSKKGSLRSVLSVLAAVEGVVDRLHASTVGADMPVQSQTEFSMSQMVKPQSQAETLPKPSASIPASVKRKPSFGFSKVLGTPRDRQRLERLRSDPSVLSLLDVYEADGTMKANAFSNTPPARALHRSFSDRRHGMVNKIKSVGGSQWMKLPSVLLSSNATEAPETSGPPDNSRSSRIRHAYYNAIKGDERVQVPSWVHENQDKAKPTERSSVRPKGLGIFVGEHAFPGPVSSSISRPSLLEMHPSDDGHLSEKSLVTEQEPYEISEVIMDPSSKLHDSMVVEAGSKDMSFPNSLDSVKGSRATRKYLRTADQNEELNDRKSVGLPRSPSRRASEVFAFLNHSRRSVEDQDMSDMQVSIKGQRVSACSKSELKENSTSSVNPFVVQGDSFASQNTTDRSIYRGIYSLLNRTPLETPIDLVERSSIQIPKSRHEIEFNPDEKDLPRLPDEQDSGSTSPVTPARPPRSFTPLPFPSPISPLGQGFSVQSPREKLNADPTARYSTMQSRIAQWEHTKPLTIDKGKISRQNSVLSQSASPSVGIKRKVPTHSDVGGLGDGRRFNTDGNRGPRRLFGPREPFSPKAPSRNSVIQPPIKRLVSNENDALLEQNDVTSSVTNENRVEMIHGYPFWQDLFPAIPSPHGPDTQKPSHHLQTPKRQSSYNEPSSASSSKLGYYGREIMALARSKTGRGPT